MLGVSASSTFWHSTTSRFRGLLPTLTRLFDVSRVPAQGFDPPKFQTAYDTLVDREMMRRMDDVLAAEPRLTFAVPLDVNAYAPAHNTVFTRDCTGESLQDLAANRTKRFFLESAALTRGARMELGVHAPGRRLSRGRRARCWTAWRASHTPRPTVPPRNLHA